MDEEPRIPYSIGLFIGAVVCSTPWVNTVVGVFKSLPQLVGWSMLVAVTLIVVVLLWRYLYGRISAAFGSYQIPLTSSQIRKKRVSLGKILPAKHREEIIGDLLETKKDLLDEGHKKWWVVLILAGKIALVLYASMKIRLEDLYSSSVKKNAGS